MEWFSVTEKMPNPGDIVRVFDGNVAVTMGVGKDQTFIPFPGFPQVHHVTHWAHEPLPIPVLIYITHQQEDILCKNPSNPSPKPIGYSPMTI